MSNETNKKSMFKVVFFVESTEDKWSLGPKIWRYYMNWFTAHEEAAFEILGIHYLKPSYRPMTYSKHKDYEKYDDDRREKGIGCKLRGVSYRVTVLIPQLCVHSMSCNLPKKNLTQKYLMKVSSKQQITMKKASRLFSFMLDHITAGFIDNQLSKRCLYPK